MKKTFKFLVCAAFLFSVAACTQELASPEDQFTGNMVRRSFVASFDPDTKTNNSGNEVFWVAGDKINIIGSNTNTSAEAANLHDGNKRADFSAVVAEGDVVYGFYPFSSKLSLSNGIISTSIPSTQSGLFADANYALATEEDGVFTFRNVTTLFDFYVSPSVFPSVTQVAIESLSGSYIAGDMTIEPLDSSPWVDVTNGKSGSSIIIVPLAQSRNRGTHAYAALIPSLLTKGVMFHLQDSKGKDIKTVTLDSRLNLLPNRMYTFGDLSNFEHLDSEEIFLETFSACHGIGGRDGENNDFGDLIEDGNSDLYTDLSGWTFYGCHEANGCLEVGDDYVNAYAITPAIGINESTNPMGLATLTFDSWALGHPGNSLFGYLTIVGNGVISNTVSELGEDGFVRMTAYIMYGDASTRVKFSGYAYPFGEYFIDNVRFVDTAPTNFEYINIPEKVFEVEADQTVLNVPMQANVKNLTASFERYPKSFIKSVYTNAYNAKVDIEPNTSVNPSTTKIRIFTSDSRSTLPKLEDNQYIYITQLGRPTIKASQELLTFAAEGGSKSVEYKLWNFDDDVVVTAGSSVPVPFTIAPVTGGFTITADENTTGDPIECTITLKAQDGKGHMGTFDIDIKQAAYASMSLSDQEINFPYTAADSTVTVSYSNFKTGVTISAESDNDAFTTSVEGNVVTISTEENTTLDPISGEVLITVSDGTNEITKPVAVSQAGAPSFIADPGSLEFSALGGESDEIVLSVINFPGEPEIKYELSDNVNFSVVATTDGYKVTALLNDSGMERNATLTFTATLGDIERIAYVAISQEDVMIQTLSFEEESYDAYYDGEDFTSPAVTGAQTTVTYSISENDFATINAATGELSFSPVANGTATVTATAAAENGYAEATASYTLVYKRLPSDCTELENGLTSNGSQYIDTGFTPNQDSRVVVDFKIDDNSRNSFIYGAAVSGSGKPVDCFGFNASPNAFYAKFGNVRTSLGDPDANEHVIDHNGASFSFDGETKTFDVENFTSPATMFLFHINATEPAGHLPAIATIYYCKVYDNGTLVRDFIPCTESGKKGMFDLVNDKFYSFDAVDE